MGLDINTPRGRKTLKQELRAYAIYEACVPEHKVVLTDKTKPCKIDALVYDRKTNVLLYVIETKCRQDVNAKEFFAKDGYRGHWLITTEHVESAAKIAHALMVPLWGFLYLVQSDELHIQILCEDDGEIVNLIGQKVMDTQDNCNGGIATRLNSFFDMNDAIKLVPPADMAAPM